MNSANYLPSASHLTTKRGIYILSGTHAPSSPGSAAPVAKTKLHESVQPNVLKSTIPNYVDFSDYRRRAIINFKDKKNHFYLDDLIEKLTGIKAFVEKLIKRQYPTGE